MPACKNHLMIPVGAFALAVLAGAAPPAGAGLSPADETEVIVRSGGPVQPVQGRTVERPPAARILVILDPAYPGDLGQIIFGAGEPMLSSGSMRGPR